MKEAKVVEYKTPIYCGADTDKNGKNIDVYIDNITFHQCYIVLKRVYTEDCKLNSSDWWDVVISKGQSICIYDAPYDTAVSTATKTAEFIVKMHNKRLKAIGLRKQLKLCI